MKNIKWNRLSLFKKRLNNKVDDVSNFDQLSIMNQNNNNNDYVINNLSKFNVHDINYTSSPIIANKTQKRSSLAVQKFRKALCSKLKNLIQQNTPKRLNLNVNDSVRPTSSSINNVKLLNFNYYNNTPKTTASSTRQLRNSFYKAIECKRHLQTELLYENYENNSFYDLKQLHQQQQQKDTFLINDNFISTSTPIEKRTFITTTTTTTIDSTFKIKQPSFDDDDDDEVIDYKMNSQEEETCYTDVYCKYNNEIDESTQLNLNTPPKLIESTFNSSSCSNMSNDLIILQHVYTTTTNSTTNKQQKQSTNKIKEFRNLNQISWNSMVIQKFHENTNASFSDIPSWAIGNQLNLALVNQFYTNPNVKTFFNSNKLK